MKKSESWGRDCHGLNPLARVSVPDLPGWMDLSFAIPCSTLQAVAFHQQIFGCSTQSQAILWSV